MTSPIDFDAAEIKVLLSTLGTRLADKGLQGEIFIVGGSAIAMLFDARRTTHDIDAILQPRDTLLDEAASMAKEMQLPPNWLSDGVLQMMPPVSDDAPRSLGSFGGLQVTAGSPEYLLAMKAMVSRKSPSDLEDAALLCKHLGFESEADIAAVVARYFGPGKVGAQELWFEDIIQRARRL